MIRVSVAQPCPLCGKPDWCLLSEDGRRVICTRVESRREVPSCSGWLHHLNGATPVVASETYATKMSPAEATELHAACLEAIDEEDIDWLADDLGVSVESLRRLGVGWHGEFECYSFPMRAGTGEVIGLRLRRPETGRKFAVQGSRSGLFIPSCQTSPRQTLYICEGESDCASLLTYGFDAMGRPSCRGSLHRLVSFVRRCRPSRVIFVADADQPGIDGARQAASRLTNYVPTAIYRPVGFKDIREMLCADVSRAELNERFEHV